MKAKSIVLSTALAGMLAAASAVHAVDVKLFPGNACQPLFGSPAAEFLNTERSIINRTASYAFVVCPIVRDNIDNLNGVKGAGVRVRSPGGLTLHSESGHAYYA